MFQVSQSLNSLNHISTLYLAQTQTVLFPQICFPFVPLVPQITDTLTAAGSKLPAILPFKADNQSHAGISPFTHLNQSRGMHYNHTH
jgi:hypothetical protein